MNHTIERLGQIILEYPGVYDPPNIHHEFKDGGHGRKLDLEAIESSNLIYHGLINCLTSSLKSNLSHQPQVLIGVANGGCRLADDISQNMSSKVTSLQTKKDQKGVFLPLKEHEYLDETKPSSVLIVDDVGTTGKTILPLFNELKINKDIKHIGVFFAWQRQEKLKYLDEAEVAYSSLIKIFLPTFKDQAECNKEGGYCARNIPLVHR